MNKIRLMIQRLLCKHTNTGQRNITIFRNGSRKIFYGKECKDCGKTW